MHKESCVFWKRVTKRIVFQYLRQQKKKQEADLNTLRKEVNSDDQFAAFWLHLKHQVVALQIMRANYQQLVKAHQQVPRNICNMKEGGKGRIWLNFIDKAPTVTEDLVPDETKFQVFQVS